MDANGLIELLSSKLVSSFGKKINLDMGDAGMVHIDGTQMPPAINMGDQEADGTIIMSLENFVKLAEGSLDPMGAFMTGTLKTQGDMGAIMALQSALGD